MVACKARLSIESCDARSLAKSICADNISYVKTRYEGGFVVTDVEVDSVGSMLVTLDDILVNLKVANDVLCGRNADEDLKE
ncbi:conserved hypothetical protein [Methanocella paludicola SANAE]|uniref:Uncharacterized protein n=1 Tax=Methanocella paludicola (strain DSM 17711 / JCM 13418 / NBRC 101707 / SANAE) TaxID=304371 RepID=D1YZE4_METPS|nr:KEOPS complex subunit Pcc1 [Methanocella paludicola]BAI61816.1 conserved hypothetical protein [Methanocella paludicola SANAE]